MNDTRNWRYGAISYAAALIAFAICGATIFLVAGAESIFVAASSLAGTLLVSLVTLRTARLLTTRRFISNVRHSRDDTRGKEVVENLLASHLLDMSDARAQKALAKIARTGGVEPAGIEGIFDGPAEQREKIRRSLEQIRSQSPYQLPPGRGSSTRLLPGRSHNE